MNVGKKLLLAITGIAAVIGPVVIGALSAPAIRAQSQPSPEFEVASIKPTMGNPLVGGFRPSRGRLTASNVTLLQLVLFAYQVKKFQVAGGPGWMNGDRFDIEAKGPDDTNLDRMHAAMQTLLRDRFGLVLHRETKQLPIYELVEAKGGTKLRPANCISPVPQSPSTKSNPMEQCNYLALGRGTFDATSASMLQIAGALSMLTGRTVIDKTGADGTFSVELRFLPDETTPQILPPIDAANPGPVNDSPDILTAVQEQLGLRLEPNKGPVEVLVIDHAERPSEN